MFRTQSEHWTTHGLGHTLLRREVATKMVALEQRHDRQIFSVRAEIIIEPSHSCKVHFVRYQEASHALHMCVTSRVHV